jgi:hypothetical protein
MKKAVLFVLVFVIIGFAVWCQSDDDFMYAIRNRGVTILGYNGRVKDVVIPERLFRLPVVTIYDGAFSNSQLTSVVIPNLVTTIESNAFTGNRLTAITIPDSVTSIGNGAFAGNQLTTVVIPNSVFYIGSRAFAGNQLATVFIPNSVRRLADDAFDPDVVITRTREEVIEEQVTEK